MSAIHFKILGFLFLILNYFPVFGVTVENYIIILLFILLPKSLRIKKSFVYWYMCPVLMYLGIIAYHDPSFLMDPLMIMISFYLIAIPVICHTLPYANLVYIAKGVIIAVLVSSFVGILQRFDINVAYKARELLGTYNDGSSYDVFKANVRNPDRPGGLALYSVDLSWQILFALILSYKIWKKNIHRLIRNYLLVIVLFIVKMRSLILYYVYFFATRRLNTVRIVGLLLLILLSFISVMLLSSDPSRSIFNDERFLIWFIFFFDNNIEWLGNGLVSHKELLANSDLSTTIMVNLGLHNFFLLGLWRAGLLFLFLLVIVLMRAENRIFLIPVMIHGMFHNIDIFILDALAMFTLAFIYAENGRVIKPKS